MGQQEAAARPMTFGELKIAVSDYLHRTDLATSIPLFIEFAQKRIEQELRSTYLQESTDIAIASGNIALPADFLRVRSLFWLSGSRKVQIKTLPSHALNAHSQLVQGGGEPQFYSLKGRAIFFEPAATEKTVTLEYYKRLIVFTQDSDTDDILTFYPQLYLHAAVAEGHLFVQDLDDYQAALSRFSEELITAAQAESVAIHGDAPRMMSS